jgi:hypothetical protein
MICVQRLVRMSTCCFRCWLDYSSGLVFAQYTPLVLMIIMTIMMIEAAGSVDDNTMTPLPCKHIYSSIQHILFHIKHNLISQEIIDQKLWTVIHSIYIYEKQPIMGQICYYARLDERSLSDFR